VGSLLYILALRRLGLSLPLTLVLILVNLATLTSWLWLPQVTPQGVALAEGVFAALPVILLVDAALLFLVGALVAGPQGQRGTWTQEVVLSLAASVALAVIYYFFGGHYLAFGETSSSLPPYLNATTLIATVILAAVVYVLGWRWSRAQ
jgi:hypothetical protein